MTTLPDTLKQAWEERDGPIVFTTIDGLGVSRRSIVALRSWPSRAATNLGGGL